MVKTAGSLSLRAGSLVCGRYTIGGQTGSGRYAATDTVTGRPMELQVLGPRFGRDVAFQERLLQTVRSVARLDHPNVATVRDWDRLGDQLLVVSDAVPGDRLTELIERRGALDPETVHRVLGGVTAALEHAHSLRVVHGHVSTDHIWITPTGGVVVKGFGLAALLRTDDMSIGGSDPVDAAADMYALGRLSYQMMCGRKPSTPWRASAERPLVQEERERPVEDLVLASARLIAADPPPPAEAAELAQAERAQAGPAQAEPDPTDLARTLEPTEPVQPSLDLPLPLPVPAQPPNQRRRLTGPRRVGPWPVAAAAFALLLVLMAMVTSPSLRTEAIPVITGATVEEAKALLSRAGFEPETRLVWSESEAGSVVGMDPPAGTELRRGSKVELVVSRGPRPVSVPSVVGMPLEEAQTVLSGSALEAGETTEVFDASLPAGHVVSQSPADGTAPRGTPVDLVVSKGPEVIDVPSVTGRTLEEAKTALTEAGLAIGRTTEAFHATAAKGTVVSQKPATGTVKRGAAIDLVISKGQDLVPLPDVAGKSRDAARKALSDAGFRWAEKTETSASVAEGVVIRSDPRQGRPAPRGSTVTLVVSSGPPMVTVPNLVGASREDARAKLVSAGLTVGSEYAVPGSGRPSGEVQGQDPAAGSRVQRGTPVNLYYAA